MGSAFSYPSPGVQHGRQGHDGRHVPAQRQLQGDTSPMPNKGTGTGVTDTYGADLGQDSCNCISENISSATRSDGMEAA